MRAVRLMLLTLLTGGVLVTIASRPAHSQTPLPMKTRLVATGLTLPTYVTAPDGDGRLFVVEQTGKIFIYKGGTKLATPFLDISSLVQCCGQRGLLGMAFAPDYAASGSF